MLKRGEKFLRVWGSRFSGSCFKISFKPGRVRFSLTAVLSPSPSRGDTALVSWPSLPVRPPPSVPGLRSHSLASETSLQARTSSPDGDSAEKVAILLGLIIQDCPGSALHSCPSSSSVVNVVLWTGIRHSASCSFGLSGAP